MEINSFFPIDKFRVNNSSNVSKKKKVADADRVSNREAISDTVTLSSGSVGKLQQQAATATIADAEVAKKELEKVKDILLEQGTKTIMSESKPLPQSVYDFFEIS